MDIGYHATGDAEMARKKTERRDVEATANLKAVRLYIPAGYHKLLRQIAADHETNMALMARRIIVEYLDRHSRKREGGAT